jgi:hypothetical protein
VADEAKLLVASKGKFLVNGLTRYFDLYSSIRQTPGSSSSTEGKDLRWQWQWVALFLGIVIQPFFAHFQATHTWSLDGFWGWAAFSGIAAIIIFPAIYRHSFDPEKPIVVQVIPIFTAGLGWQSLLTTAVKAAVPS